jgi:hypothetical protein
MTWLHTAAAVPVPNLVLFEFHITLLVVEGEKARDVPSNWKHLLPV